MPDNREMPSARPFFTTKQAGFYLGLSARRVQQMRADGQGPFFRRHGKYVVYHIDDLEAWSLANRANRTHHA